MLFCSLILSSVLVALCLSEAGFAAAQLEARSGSVCSSGIYGELAPILAK